ncbi:MAG TPA: hypothetical protein VK806_12965 [Bacteroidia bacterium]|jgi:hypothetical protein|nr:hypothetical protein [Bacteroidia bacterium]
MRSFVRITYLFIFFSISKSYAQDELNIGLVMPAGYTSYILKPAPCFEFAYGTGEFDDHYHFGFSIGYSRMFPTQDTFRTYGLGGQTGGLLPGYEVIHKYTVLPIGLRNEYVLLTDKKVSPIIACDVYFYVITIDEDDYAETAIQSSEQGDNYWLLSILPRLGLQYKLNDSWLLTGGFGRSMSFAGIVQAQAFWKAYVGIKYYVK